MLKRRMQSAFKALVSINPVTLTIGSILVVVCLFAAETAFLDTVELKTYDLRLQSRGRLKPTPAVVLALIDEKSLDREGRWPWPRSKIARLVDVLSAGGARVIGFDIGFLEPDENSQLGLIREMEAQIDNGGIDSAEINRFLKQREKQADNDLLLAEAIERSSADVILGYFFHMDPASLDYDIAPGKIERALARIKSSKYTMILYEDPEMASAPFVHAYAPESNLALLAKAAEGAGYYSVKSDPDGVVRQLPLIIQCGKYAYPPLSVACAWHLLGKPPMMVKVGLQGVEGIQMGRRFIPTDESGQLLINYLGPPKTFPHLSISDILDGTIPKAAFKDRIVLVGATAMGTHDLRSTPVSPLFPGVEIHATVIDNILLNEYITKPRWTRIYDLMAIVLLGMVIGFVLPRLSAIKGVIAASILFVVHIAFAHWLFVEHRVWLNIVYPLLALAITYTALTVYHYVTEERERKKIKGTFRQYVAPLVIEEMLQDPGQLKLGGEEKVLTVLFSDLAGFTSYSERYAPSQMIDFLSDYFNHMTEQVFQYQGTLKEYVGDELMAIFGAPIAHTDHAHRACKTALAMRDRLRVLRAEWAKLGRPPLTARTGVNSGPMLVGNLGSRYRFAYGVLGDQVNLGSRLEGLNKMYATEVLIGEGTAELVGGDFQMREVDMVRVKGRKQPVRIYELLARAETVLPADQLEAHRIYAAGLAAYRHQDWTEAIRHFNQVLAVLPDDGAAQTMAERCRIYLETPPPQDWDGVFTMLTK